jgi:hypothetical protein
MGKGIQMGSMRFGVIRLCGLAAVMRGLAATPLNKNNADTGEPIRIVGMEFVNLDFSRTDDGIWFVYPSG